MKNWKNALFWSKQKKVTLEEIHSLCGLLNFACLVIHPGQALLRRLFELTRGFERPNHRVKLKRGCQDDLKVWWEFKKKYFNGKCFFLDENFLNSDRVNLYTDASGIHGYEAVFGNSWFYGPWDHTWDNGNIAVKELYPIIVDLEVGRGVHMANSCICIQCDNEALVYVLNKQSSKESQIMFMNRKLVLLALQYNILFKAEHIPRKKNYLSDLFPVYRSKNVY